MPQALPVPRPSGAPLAARRLALAAALACALVSPAAHAQGRVANPFAGATWYLSQEYASNVAASAAQVADPTLKAKVANVANYPTAFWLDRIAAINGYAGRMGLAAHLDAALAQQKAGQPMVVMVVVYDLPGRDCSALASNGELGPADIDKYKSQFIDPIAAIEGNAKYGSLRIVNIIEIDSLPNIVTNVGGKAGATALCDTMKQNGNYVAGIQYALGKLHAAGPNTYNYVDAGHHGWLGWDDNLNAVAQLFADTVKGAQGGYDTVQGFIANTANYSALVEPYLTVTDQTRASKWIDWNRYVDEKSYAKGFRTKLTTVGFNSSIGMLIDTSRNGWGGAARPTKASTASDVNTMVNESRIDRRLHAGNWCNQSGAGLGERPQAVDADGIHAYVWVKPPGESDGASKTIPNADGKSADQMCDPTYTGNARNGNSLTGALADAPLAGAWFHSQLLQLVENAYPPVPADGGSSSSSSGGSGSSGSSSGGSGSSSGGSSSGGPGTGDFQLGVSPSSLTVNQDQGGSSTILVGKVGGFGGTVSLSASGLPAGVTASFQPATTSGQSALTFTASSTAAIGMTTVTISGTSGALTHTATLFLTVRASGSPSFSVSASPASLSIARGASASSTISLQPSGGFSGTVGLTAEGLPAGVTASFANQYPTASTAVTFTAGSTAPVGSITATIVGTAGGVTRATTVQVTVTDPGGSSSGGSSSGGSSSGGSSSGGSSSGGSSSGGASSGGSSSGGSGGRPSSGGGCSSTGAPGASALLLALLGAARLRPRRRRA